MTQRFLDRRRSLEHKTQTIGKISENMRERVVAWFACPNDIWTVIFLLDRCIEHAGNNSEVIHGFRGVAYFKFCRGRHMHQTCRVKWLLIHVNEENCFSNNVRWFTSDKFSCCSSVRWIYFEGHMLQLPIHGLSICKWKRKREKSVSRIPWLSSCWSKYQLKSLINY
jgi:hypothetical protein